MADPKSSSRSSSYRSQKTTAADLSLGEKLRVVPAIINTVANTVLALFTGVWYAKERRPESYYRYVALTGIRDFVGRLSPRQQHYISLPTDDAYAKVCKRRGQAPSSEILEDGTKAHWIGKKRAEKLVINFHGGGYVLPASEHMVEFMFQVVDVLNNRGKDAACLFLAYDLAPGAVYPRQLQQAATLLTHVLHTLHYPPSSILVMGDSAGANLCMALLSHISHPHPSTEVSIPKVKLGDEKLLGVVLISPWISFEIDSHSFRENEWKDCVGAQAGTSWSSAFLACPWPHTGHKDAYNEALSAPSSWWAGLCVSSMLVVCGSEEVLRDGIVNFEGNLREGFALAGKESTELEFHVVKGEYHDQPSIDLQMGYTERDEGQTARIVKSWVGSKL